MDPMSVRVANYFPFNVACYLNGYSLVAQELTRAEVAFRKADNAVVGVADVAALQTAAQRFERDAHRATLHRLGATTGARFQPD
jgi:hypothetical protein